MFATSGLRELGTSLSSTTRRLRRLQEQRGRSRRTLLLEPLEARTLLSQTPPWPGGLPAGTSGAAALVSVASTPGGNGGGIHALAAATTITVSGTVKWTDDVGGTHAVPLAPVEIRATTDGTTSTVIATATTDTSGNYTVTITPNSGMPNVFAWVYARSPFDDVQPYGADAKTYYIESATKPAAGATLRLDVTADNTGYKDLAFAVDTALVMVGDYASSLTGKALPLLTTVFPYLPFDLSDHDPAFTSRYSPEDKKMFVTKEAATHFDEIDHEYGHYVADSFKFDMSPGGNHRPGVNNASGSEEGIRIPAYGKQNGLRLAWSEGWATYFAISGQITSGAAALGIPTVGDHIYDSKSWLFGSGSLSLDTLAADHNAVGEDDEGSVSGVLWNMYLTSQDATSTLSYTDKSIFDLINASKSVTIGDFWEAAAAKLDTKGETQLGKIFGDMNIAPVPLTPADNFGSKPTDPPPKFTWKKNGGGTPNPLNDFKIQFYSGDFSKLILEKNLGNTDNYTPSADDWKTILAGDQRINWVIEGKNTTAPATPGGALGRYWSVARTIDIIAPPAATTQAATDVVTPTTATLNGSVNPNGASTNASFQYSTDPTLGSGVVTVSAATGLTGTSPVPVSTALTGLTPGTTYYYRVMATSAGGTTDDAIVRFTTLNVMTSITLNGSGNLIITDTTPSGKNDTLTTRLSGGNVIITDPNNTIGSFAGATQVDAHTVSVPLASITGRIQFDTLGDDDTLIVDSSGGGIPVPIAYDGGTGSNALTLQGGTALTDTYAPGPNVGSGTSTLTFTGGVAETIQFQNLAPVLDTVPGPLTVMGTAANDVINYGVGSVPANGLVTVNNFESIEFSSKTTLTFNAGAGDDTITVNNPNTPTGLTAITVDGGSGIDTLMVNALGNAVDVATAGTIQVTSQLPVQYGSIEKIQILNAPDQPLTAAPASIQGTEGAPLTTVVVGGFSDGPNTPGTPKGKASDFTATIDWGDGPIGNPDVTAGQVVDLGNGNFQVLGSHTYAIARTYTLTVTITDNGSNGTTVVGGVPIMIQDPGGQATQISSQVTVMNGPTVVSLQRFGFHAQPTLLVLTFSTPLDPARAQDLSNYRLVALRPARRFGPGHGRLIALRSAVFDPTRLTVTLVPAERLYLRHFFQLTVKGTSPGGVTDMEGRLLDGNRDGAPGGDFVGQIGPGSLAGPAIASRTSGFLHPFRGTRSKIVGPSAAAVDALSVSGHLPSRPPSVRSHALGMRMARISSNARS